MAKRFIAAVDEVGRGPIAGPVVAACIYAPYGLREKNETRLAQWGVKDSKKLSPARRQAILLQAGADVRSLGQGRALSLPWGASAAVAQLGPRQIEKSNILACSLQAMAAAFAACHSPPAPGELRVDGPWALPGPYPQDIVQRPLVKGDGRCVWIALASIIAKEFRDLVMGQLHDQFPHYGLGKHKGYPTKEHLQALQRHGPCESHRRSFQPVRDFNHAKESSNQQNSARP